MNRDLQIKELRALSYQGLCEWLIEHFTPARYQAGNDDVIEIACYILFEKYHTHQSMVAEFINRLWGMHGELPDHHYNIDSYGRMQNAYPNYDKLGMRERVRDVVDSVTPSYQELYRKGQK